MNATGRTWSRPRRTCPDWCVRRTAACPAQEGRPGGEHRAAPITLTVPGAGTVVLTRVQTIDGSEHADIRLSVALPDHEPHARQRLTALLTHLRTLVGPARATGRAA